MGAKGLHAPRCLYQHFFSPSPFPDLGAITKKYRNRFNSYHTLKTIYNSQIPVFSRNTLPGVHLLPSALLLPASVVAKGFILCILPDRPLQPGVPRAIIGSGCERHNPRGAIHIIDITDLYIFTSIFQQMEVSWEKSSYFWSAQGCGAGRQGLCSALRRRKAAQARGEQGKESLITKKDSSRKEFLPCLLKGLGWRMFKKKKKTIITWRYQVDWEVKPPPILKFWVEDLHFHSIL